MNFSFPSEKQRIWNEAPDVVWMVKRADHKWSLQHLSNGAHLKRMKEYQQAIDIGKLAPEAAIFLLRKKQIAVDSEPPECRYQKRKDTTEKNRRRLKRFIKTNLE